MNALPEIKNPLASARVVGENMPYEEYSHQLVERGHPQYVLGRSDLLDFDRCPHKWRCGYTSEDTEATDWGQLFEAIVMYPADVKERFATCPETYRDAKTGEDKPWTFAAKVCKQWREHQGKKQIVKADQFTQAQNAAKFFFGNHRLAVLVNGSKKQVMVEGTYHDQETGLDVPLHGLIDFVPTVEPLLDSLADLKTTRNADPHAWGRDVFTYGLHVQGALYLDLWNKATGEERTTFRHAISESGPPWETACRILSQDFITLGRMRYIEALQRYCRCLADDIWPGYDTSEHGECYDGWLLTMPEPWMVNR